MRTFQYDPSNPRRESVLAFACQFIREAGKRLVISVREPTRSLEINSAMWCLLGDVSKQVQWPIDGVMQTLTPEEWKHIFTAAATKTRVAPGIDGGFVVMSARTSRMTQAEMRDLLLIIEAFGAERNVVWTEQVVK